MRNGGHLDKNLENMGKKVIKLTWVRLTYRAFINDFKGVVGHGFQKSRFAEIMPVIMHHYDSSHLSH